jgi:hypothetical protein
MTGLSRDQLVGLDLFVAFPKNAAAPARTDYRTGLRSLRAALALGRSAILPIFRHDLLGADGVWRERYWGTITRPIKDDKGSPIALDVEILDRTREGVMNGQVANDPAVSPPDERPL